ncbi:MAG: DUF456 domain-containing protein [Gemmatimonadota bacterium]|nr:DUF456 domain-containing protein [Gemmatimonadota bacterium]
MTAILLLLLLGACFVTGLALVPLGLPGLWLMVLGVIGYGWLTDFQAVGLVTIVLALGLAFVGEILEAVVGFRFTQRYGGSKRAGWGALVGGIAGAIVGVPVPLVGSVIGAIVGSFAGAALFEYLRSRRARVAVGAGWGAVLGRAAAAALKIALGLVIAVATAVAIWQG